MPAAFALVGMGGFFCGVSKTPLTSIVMVCELTGNYSLLVPLMLVCGLTWVSPGAGRSTKSRFRARSTAPRTRATSSSTCWSGLRVGEIPIRTEGLVLVPDATPFTEVVRIVARSSETLFLVTNRDGKLTGVFNLRDIRLALTGHEWAPLVLADDLASRPVLTVTPDDDLHTALRRLTELNTEEIPVVAQDDADAAYRHPEPSRPGRGLLLADRRPPHSQTERESGMNTIFRSGMLSSPPEHNRRGPNAAVSIRDRSEAILADWEKARRDHALSLTKAKTKSEREAALKLPAPDRADVSRRLVNVAESAPTDPAARDALIWVVEQAVHATDWKGPYAVQLGRAVDLCSVFMATTWPRPAPRCSWITSCPEIEIPSLTGLVDLAHRRDVKGTATLAKAQYLEMKALWLRELASTTRPYRMESKKADEKGNWVKVFSDPVYEQAYEASPA